MADNVTTPRYVRLQRALTGKPLEKRTREELETIATEARITVEGTGKEGYVTLDDYRSAIQGAATPRTTRAPAPVTTTEEE